jgi:hypothetical protein
MCSNINNKVMNIKLKHYLLSCNIPEMLNALDIKKKNWTRAIQLVEITALLWYRYDLALHNPAPHYPALHNPALHNPAL